MVRIHPGSPSHALSQRLRGAKPAYRQHRSETSSVGTADVKLRDAAALLDAGAWEQAREAFTKALAAPEEDAAATAEGWLGLSRTLTALGDQPRSDAALSQAYKLAPANVRIVAASARRFVAEGAFNEALVLVKRASASASRTRLVAPPPRDPGTGGRHPACPQDVPHAGGPVARGSRAASESR